MGVEGWVASGLAVMALVVGPWIGVKFERHRARTGAAGVDDHNLSRQARSLIDYQDRKLSDLQRGFTKPTRERPLLHIDDDGRLAGWTESTLGAGDDDLHAQIALVVAVREALRMAPGRRRRKADRLLTDLVGSAVAELADTARARQGDAASLPLMAVAASFSGRRTFTPSDARGSLIDALIESSSDDEVVRKARSQLKRLDRLIAG